MEVRAAVIPRLGQRMAPHTNKHRRAAARTDERSSNSCRRLFQHKQTMKAKIFHIFFFFPEAQISRACYLAENDLMSTVF